MSQIDTFIAAARALEFCIRDAKEWEKQFGNTIEPTEVETFKQAAKLELTSPVIANLKGQILAQGTTDKWKGEGKGSAEKNAEDMAKILADAGITDIKQFGKVTTYEPVQEIAKSYNGQTVRTTTDENTGQTLSYILIFIRLSRLLEN